MHKHGSAILIVLVLLSFSVSELNAKHAIQRQGPVGLDQTKLKMPKGLAIEILPSKARASKSFDESARSRDNDKPPVLGTEAKKVNAFLEGFKRAFPKHDANGYLPFQNKKRAYPPGIGGGLAPPALTEFPEFANPGTDHESIGDRTNLLYYEGSPRTEPGGELLEFPKIANPGHANRTSDNGYFHYRDNQRPQPSGIGIGFARQASIEFPEIANQGHAKALLYSRNQPGNGWYESNAGTVNAADFVRGYEIGFRIGFRNRHGRGIGTRAPKPFLPIDQSGRSKQDRLTEWSSGHSAGYKDGQEFAKSLAGK